MTESLGWLCCNPGEVRLVRYEEGLILRQTGINEVGPYTSATDRHGTPST